MQWSACCNIVETSSAQSSLSEMVFFNSNLFVVALLLPSVFSFALSRAPFSPLSSRLHALKPPLLHLNQERSNIKDSFTLEKPVYKPKEQFMFDGEAVSRNVLKVATVAAGVYGTLLTGKAVATAAGGLLIRKEDNERSSSSIGPFRLSGYGTRLSYRFRRLMDAADSLLLGPGNFVDLTSWSTGTLISAWELPGGFKRYRFKLPLSSNVIALDVGQELDLCLVDSKDRVLRDSYFPVSRPGAKGYFDVIASMISPDRKERLTLNAEEKVCKALQELQMGDEVAFRGGKHRLNKPRTRSSADDGISHLSMVAAGSGIAPTLQLLRGALDKEGIGEKSSLGDKPSSGWNDLLHTASVKNLELLWLNERPDEFLCGDEIVNLEYRHGNRFGVHRVIEPDLFSPELTKNSKFRNLISPYRPKSVAIICAPEHLVEQFRFLYREMGYPIESIISVVTSSL